MTGQKGHTSVQVRDSQGNLMPNVNIASFSGTLLTHRTTRETWLVSGDVDGFIDTVMRGTVRSDFNERQVNVGQSVLGD